MSRVTRKTLPALVAALLALAVTAAVAEENVVVRSFPAGQGPNAVGLVEAGEDTELAGPEALYAGDDGELFLLDQVNSRVLQFDPGTPDTQARSLELPPTMQPTDLIVVKGDILVWDGEVRALQASGGDGDMTRSLEARDGAPVDDIARSTFAQMGSQPVESTTDLLASPGRSLTAAAPRVPVKQFVASRGKGAVAIDVIPGSIARATLEVRPQGEAKLMAALKLEVRHRLGAVEFLDIDRSGRMFVLAEDIPATTRAKPAAFVARYSARGKLEAVFEIPLAESAALSRRFLTVSPAGDVYFLRTKKSAVEIVGVTPHPVRDGAVLDSRIVEAPPVGGSQKVGGLIAAVRQLTRKQVLDNALAFETARWHVSNSAYGPDPDTACDGFRRIRRPIYLQGRMGQDVQGIPYCWGCQGSLNQIRAKLDRGDLAGNVCTRNNPRRDVVGVDCSSFVSAAWGLSTHFTTVAIPSITRELTDPWDLQPGDALNKPGSHVVLFLRFTPDKKIEVMEASPNSCRGRVCRNVYPLASVLARGYHPVRYRALTD